MPNYSPLYRVFPWLEAAELEEPGHPLYVASPQGEGRIDNPEHYSAMYLADNPLGAIGESFGNHSTWTSDLLAGPPVLPGSVRALATFDAEAVRVLDLDDPRALLDRSLRPSRVVTRERSSTQRWALEIFNEGTWDGIRWWSFHNPEWGSFGLWEKGALRLTDVLVLADQVELVQRAALEMNRVWDPS